MVAQGELWLMETPNRKRRPVLVISRDEVIPVVNNVVVAPVTSTIRDIPTRIPVGVDEGIDHDSVATFDGGAQSGNRTHDLLITSELLYRLSHLGGERRV